MTSYIDSHAHLDDKRFDKDREEVIKRAKDAGLKSIITVACWDKKTGFAGVESIVKRHEFIFASLGVHPHEAKDVANNAPFDLMKRLSLSDEMKGRIVAIGETGLDYHYDHSPKEIQKEVFIRQIRLARELNLPLIVHTREAHEDTMEILKAEGAPSLNVLFHCFSGSPREAKEAQDIGAYISVSGVVTFPKARGLREAIKEVPMERLLIETDCPYLAPQERRGQRNEPAFVVNTARAVAEIKGLSDADVGRITTLNAEGFFGLGKGAEPEIKIAYPIRNSLYVNVTNRCTNHCSFCAKFKSYTVKGHYLRLREEPDARRIMQAIGPDPSRYDEIVFCGFGEPLIRLDVVKEAGTALKKMGCRIRIDTDGLANLVHKRNVLTELKFADCLSISLNAPDSETYQRLVKTPFGPDAYPAILFFLKEAKKHVAKVVASVVAVPGLDIEACRKVAEDDLGVGFRVREYDSVG